MSAPSDGTAGIAAPGNLPAGNLPAGEPPAGAPAPAPGRKGNHRRRKPQRPFWLEAVVLLAIAMGIALIVHTFLFQAFYIPSGSMENTLHVGDRVLVNRLSYKVGHVQRGQIVVFNGEDSWTPEATTTPPSNAVARVARDVGSFLGFAPAGEKDFIKRVIGVPGDHVVCCDAQGRIKVNGTPLDETYLASGIPVATPTTTRVNAARPFDIVVPAGRLWVEGDHRDDSADSRSHTGDAGGGTIPESKVIGRAFVIVWPMGHVHGLSVPSSYRSLANATAIGLPYGIGAVATLPVGFVRLRRRRRDHRAVSKASSAAS
jgi:signal peptidase I